MDGSEIRSRLGDYESKLIEYKKLKALPDYEKADDLESYQKEILDSLIAHQSVVGRIVVNLVPGARFPQMAGISFGANIPVIQKQLISTALVNLDADPALADQFTLDTGGPTPWIETADELDALADKLHNNAHWREAALHAVQLLKRFDSDAADALEGELRSREGPHLDAMKGTIEGAAAGLRRFGPYVQEEVVAAAAGVAAPAQTFYIQQHQGQAQQQAALSAVSIEEVLAWDQLPEGLRADLELVKQAKDAGDKPKFFERLADFAKKAEALPSFVAKVGNVWDWVSSLLTT